MMRVYAAMAQKERELISERTRAALGAAKARGARLGLPAMTPARPPWPAVTPRRAAHRLLLEVERLREAGVTSRQALARALTERGVLTPQGGDTWTHTTVGRLLARKEARTVQAADPFPLPA
jgi:DNA invertase Pin-like site-specific DNA recombinase